MAYRPLKGHFTAQAAQQLGHEAIQRSQDDAPSSPGLEDRAHREWGCIDRAQQVFLGGCNLPAAWANAAQWRVLDTCFGAGLSFLLTWAAWQADPQRARMLHFVGVESSPVARNDLLQALPSDPVLQALGQQLADQWWGLLPGVHRLSFDEGQVLLTLYIGEAQTLLRKQQVTADSVFLHGLAPQTEPTPWDDDAIKSVTRHCRRGTRLASHDSGDSLAPALKRQGFEVLDMPNVAGISPTQPFLQATYNPTWEPRHRTDGMPAPVERPSQCLVLGAGLAGAAAAASLARRGWQVTVLDAAAEAAAGASGLPAGLFCPHTSPDDSVLSRMSRSGVRTTLQTLKQLTARQALQPDQDWAHGGVLEHDLHEPAHLPPSWLQPESDASPWGLHWSAPAQNPHLQAAQLSADSHAIWHAQAGWVRPAQLVRALLNSPQIQWQGNAQAARLQRDATRGLWQVLDAQGLPLAQVSMLVLALGPDTKPLLQASGLAAGQWELQAIRGQVSVANHCAQTLAAMPPFPVNGHGNLVPDFPTASGQRQWVMGSTFERDVTELPPSAADQQAAHASNGDKLAALLPQCRQALGSFFDTDPQPETWSRVRCAAYDRLPLAGPAGNTADDLPGLWVLTGLGSRGLTLSMLCAELLAARLHGEPLPLDAKLAQALGTQRMQTRASKDSSKP